MGILYWITIANLLLHAWILCGNDRNIIDGGKVRPRRRAAAPVAFHSTVKDLPSDLSGPELSEDEKDNAEEEEEVDEYSLPSDSE